MSKAPRETVKISQKDASNGDLNFSIVTFCGFIFDNSSDNGPIKRTKMCDDANFLTNSSGGLVSFVSALVCRQINFLYNQFSKITQNHKFNSLVANCSGAFSKNWFRR